jgi:transposase InsO family protein
MVTDALRQALQVRRRGEHAWVAAGLIHHSDAGSQYVSVAFTAELIDAGIAGSIGSVGDALDNALCESTIGLFKTEAINPADPAWTDRRDVEWQVARWTHWFRYAGHAGVSSRGAAAPRQCWSGEARHSGFGVGTDVAAGRR